MITEHDLYEAIAECQGQKNPDANTCILLASLLTILDYYQQKREPQAEPPPTTGYSLAAKPTDTATYDSGTEFSQAIDGKDTDGVYAVMDELMQAVSVINPRLYNATLKKFRGL